MPVAEACFKADVRFDDWFRGEAEDSRDGVTISIGGDWRTIVRGGMGGCLKQAQVGVAARAPHAMEIVLRVVHSNEMVALSG